MTSENFALLILGKIRSILHDGRFNYTAYTPNFAFEEHDVIFINIPCPRSSHGIWTKRLADSSVAVSIINRGSRPEDVTVKARDIGMLDTPKLARNLWIQEDIADFKTELKQRVQPHETVLLKVS